MKRFGIVITLLVVLLTGCRDKKQTKNDVKSPSLDTVKTEIKDTTVVEL